MIVRKLLTSCVLAVAVSLLWWQDAHAYVDPATGSYIIQVIIAALLGVALTLKIYWRSFKSFVTRLFGGNTYDEEQ